MYKIEVVYEGFYKNKELFDFSNYSKDSKYYNDAKDLFVSKRKYKTCGVSIKGFVELKSKMYTFITGSFKMDRFFHANKKLFFCSII